MSRPRRAEFACPGRRDLSDPYRADRTLPEGSAAGRPDHPAGPSGDTLEPIVVSASPRRGTGRTVFQPSVRWYFGRHLMTGWRRRWDSNPRWPCDHNGFRDRPIRPLSHSSNWTFVFPLPRVRFSAGRQRAGVGTRASNRTGTCPKRPPGSTCRQCGVFAPSSPPRAVPALGDIELHSPAADRLVLQERARFGRGPFRSSAHHLRAILSAALHGSARGDGGKAGPSQKRADRAKPHNN